MNFLTKMRFSKCELLDKLRISAPVLRTNPSPSKLYREGNYRVQYVDAPEEQRAVAHGSRLKNPNPSGGSF